MKAAFHTLGCKVNSYESQAILEQFESQGFEITDFTEAADVYVINTCSVTQMAEHKSRQLIHRAKKLNPDAVIVATGCYVQRAGDEIAADGAVDIVVGNNRKSEIVQLVLDFMNNRQAEADSEIIIDELTHCTFYEPQQISRLGENVRAYVKIQDGCNRFCSYCIIPYVRGRSRCREQEDIVSEVKNLAANGYKEIVLTGIDISMYDGLIDLIETINKIDGIERIRLGSLEVSIVTEDFISRFAACSKACPQFHLSLQSGCDATLKRMNRKYTSAEYADKVRLIRKYFDICSITTDVIVGFVGETDKDFEESLEFVKQMRFTQTHVFKYSRRKGTAADRMPEQVPENIKNERSARLIEETDLLKKQYEENMIGRIRPVLIEEFDKTASGKTVQTGFTPEYLKIAVECSESLVNQIVPVRLTGFDTVGREAVMTGVISGS